MSLNVNALNIVRLLLARADEWSIQAHMIGDATVVDCGVHVPGSIEAGLHMARAALAGLAGVALRDGRVFVECDRPVVACLASQYAGWKIDPPGYFAMGSGPMRALLGEEKIFDCLCARETCDWAVGLLESRSLPSDDVIAWLASKLEIPPANITLLVAPAASVAGTIQVVSRGLETALHKLHELQFDLSVLRSGMSDVPVPPVGRSEIDAIGHTNDAILYGARTVLAVDCEDAILEEIGPRVPSSASPDHGTPFAEIFRRYDGDFYKIDPLLFSPAVVEFNNLRTGRSHRFGEMRPDILKDSWASCESRS